MPWEEPGESDPPPRLPRGGCSGKAALRRSLRAPRSYRPPASAGELRRARGGGRGGAAAPSPRSPSPAQRRLLPEAAAAASVALSVSGLDSESARRAASVRLGARQCLSAAGGAAQCPAQRPQPAAAASCPIRPEGGEALAPSHGSATGSAPAPRLQFRALRSRRTPRPAPRGREAELGPGPRPRGGGTRQKGGAIVYDVIVGVAMRWWELGVAGSGWNDTGLQRPAVP